MAAFSSRTYIKTVTAVTAKVLEAEVNEFIRSLPDNSTIENIQSQHGGTGYYAVVWYTLT